MKIAEKLNKKNKDIYGEKPLNLVFLGDSVTQGCFECYYDNDGMLCTRFDRSAAYSTKLGEMLAQLYPCAQVNIVNSGLSGDGTDGGLKRFDRDVATYSPDLVVLGFALNDCMGGREKLNNYTDNIAKLIAKSKALGAEVIVLTPNMLNTEVSCHLSDDRLKKIAADFMTKQGVLDEYVGALKVTAEKCGAKVCDVHKFWKQMNENGVDVTELLANKLNHPVPQLHYYTAIKLLEIMLDN